MGEVYRARDTKLNRDVAIKVLSSALANDASARARFEREAQSVAQLSHPNILNIFDFGVEGPTAYAAMELLEGETLRDRLAAGLIPARKAVEYAVQIAQGLAAAHAKGIVHRDLKPENLFITASDRIKILDFGLAKPFQAGPTEATMANQIDTAVGTVLGTVGYMAPEQLRGHGTDHRADIFAFGCVLYEIISGQRAFRGETAADTISAILNTEPPDLANARIEVTPALDRIVRRCLEKKPDLRFQSSQDLAFALEGASRDSGSHASSSGVVSTETKSSTRSRVLPFTLLAFVAGALAVFAWVQTRSTVSAPSLELAIAPPDGAAFRFGLNSGNVVVSPDGQRVAFVATSASGEQLWVRTLERDDARALPGTDGVSYPFWAPNSRAVGFFSSGKVRTIDVAGGLPQVIADATDGRGGTWGESGIILFSRAPAEGGTIFRTTAAGAAVQAVTTLDAQRGDNAHYWPQLLVGDKKFLYFIRSVRPEHNGIYIGYLDGSRPSVRLVSSLSSGFMADTPSGPYLMWVRDGELLAQAIDIDADVLRGSATSIASGVRVEDSQRVTLASASRSGTLVWATARGGQTQVSIKSRHGNVLSTLAVESGRPQGPSISPDGTRLLLTRVERGTADIWLYDLQRGTSRQVTSGAGYDEQPKWSPDGRSFAFREGSTRIFKSALDGSPPHALADLKGNNLSGWSPDGRFVLFSVSLPETGNDLVALPVDQARPPIHLTADRGIEQHAAFALDGRWVAFAAERAGRMEVFAAAAEYRGDGLRIGNSRIAVSTDGADRALWRADNKEIFFKGLDGWLYAVAVRPDGDAIAFGKPVKLFGGVNYWNWDVMPDGQHFIVVDEPYAASQTLRVLTNWSARLRQ